MLAHGEAVTVGVASALASATPDARRGFAAACESFSRSSLPAPPNSLAKKLGMRLPWLSACATAVPLASEAYRLPSGPFDNTLASCASGMRGQWRTLPVSRCTNGAPDVG